MREDVLPNDEVVVITARDEDEGANAKITYTAEPEVPGSYVPFYIEPETGVVKFKDAVSLDAEKNGSQPFMLRVTATDGGQPPRHSSTLVEVSFFNLSSPRFIRHILLLKCIKENRTVFVFKILKLHFEIRSLYY